MISNEHPEILSRLVPDQSLSKIVIKSRINLKIKENDC